MMPNRPIREELLRRWLRYSRSTGTSSPGRRMLAVRILLEVVERELWPEPGEDNNMLAVEIGQIAARNLAGKELGRPAKETLYAAVVRFYEGLSERMGPDYGWALDDFWRDVIREMRRVSPNSADREYFEQKIEVLLADYLLAATDSEPSLTFGYAAMEGLIERGGAVAVEAWARFLERSDGPEWLTGQAKWALGQVEEPEAPT